MPGRLQSLSISCPAGGGWGGRREGGRLRAEPVVCQRPRLPPVGDRVAGLGGEIAEHRTDAGKRPAQRRDREGGAACGTENVGGAPGPREDRGHRRSQRGVGLCRPVQLGLEGVHGGAAGEPVRPLEDLQALGHALAFPGGHRRVECVGVVEHRRRLLAEQAAVPQRVPDALCGDGILEMACVARQRPARTGRPAEVGDQSGRRAHPPHPLAACQPRRQTRNPRGRRGITLFGGARSEPLGARGGLHEAQQQAVVARERRAQVGALAPLGGDRAAIMVDIAPVGVEAVASARPRQPGLARAGQPGDRAAPPVRSHHQRRPQLPETVPLGVADTHAAPALPDQFRDAGPLAQLRPRRRGGRHQCRVQAGAPHAQRVVDPVDRLEPRPHRQPGARGEGGAQGRGAERQHPVQRAEPPEFGHARGPQQVGGQRVGGKAGRVEQHDRPARPGEGGGRGRSGTARPDDDDLGFLDARGGGTAHSDHLGHSVSDTLSD